MRLIYALITLLVTNSTLGETLIGGHMTTNSTKVDRNDEDDSEGDKDNSGIVEAGAPEGTQELGTKEGNDRLIFRSFEEEEEEEKAKEEEEGFCLRQNTDFTS